MSITTLHARDIASYAMAVYYHDGATAAWYWLLGAGYRPDTHPDVYESLRHQLTELPLDVYLLAGVASERIDTTAAIELARNLVAAFRELDHEAGGEAEYRTLRDCAERAIEQRIAHFGLRLIDTHPLELADMLARAWRTR